MNIPTGDDRNDKECDDNQPGGPQGPVELPLCPFCGKEPIIDGTWAYCDNHSGQVELEIEDWCLRYEPSPSRAELLAEISALKADRDNLRAFAVDIMGDWPEGGNLDGGDIQDIASEHGLLIETTVTESCGEGCTCQHYTSFPTTCFRKTQLLTGSKEAKCS